MAPRTRQSRFLTYFFPSFEALKILGGLDKVVLQLYHCNPLVCKVARWIYRVNPCVVGKGMPTSKRKSR